MRNFQLIVKDILRTFSKYNYENVNKLFNLLNGVPITIGKNFYVTTVQWTDPLDKVYRESLFMAAS